MPKLLLSLFVFMSSTLAMTQHALSGKKQDRAAYNNGYKMEYHRNFASQVETYCPLLSKEGTVLMGGSSLTNSWSENDSRYDILFKYWKRGEVKGKSDAKKLASKKGNAFYCKEAYKRYGLNGTIDKGIIVRIKPLSKQEQIVHFGQYAHEMTVQEARSLIGGERCSRTNNDVVKICRYSKKTDKYSFSMEKTPLGRTVNMYYSVPLPSHLKDDEALRQVRSQFKRFLSHDRINGGILWVVKKGVRITATVAENTHYMFGHRVVDGRYLALNWKDKDAEKENKARYTAKKDQKDRDLEEKRRKKASRTELPL